MVALAGRALPLTESALCTNVIRELTRVSNLEAPDGARYCLVVIGSAMRWRLFLWMDNSMIRKSLRTVGMVRITCPMARATACSRNGGSPLAARMLM